MTDDRRPLAYGTATDTDGGDAESTFRLIERARAGDRRRTRAPVRPPPETASAVGQRPAAASGRATSPTPTISFSTRSFTPSGRSRTSSRVTSARFRRISGRRCSIASATKCGGKAAGPTAPTWTTFKLAGGESPLEEAIGREAVERYERALARLKPEERAAIVAKVELGCSYGELAEALGKPTPDAARKAAQRALLRLAER